MLIRRVSRGTRVAVMNKSDPFSKNVALTALTGHIEDFTRRTKATFEGHLHALHQLVQGFGSTSRTLLLKSGMSSFAIRSFRFNETEMRKVLDDVEPHVLGQFRVQSANLIRCTRAMTGRLRQVDWTRSDCDLHGCLNAIIVLLIAMQKVIHFCVHLPNHDFTAAVKDVIEIQKAIESEIMSRGLRTDMQAKLSLASTLLNFVVTETFQSELSVGSTDAGLLYHFFRSSLDKTLRGMNPFHLSVWYKLLHSRKLNGGLVTVVPLLMPALEQKIAGQWDPAKGAWNTHDFSEFLRNKSYVLRVLFQKMDQRKAKNELLRLQRTILDLPAAQRQALTLDCLASLFKIPLETKGSPVVEMFRRLGDLFPQLAGQILLKNESECSPQSFKILLSVFKLKTTVLPEDLERLLTLQEHFSKLCATWVRTNTSSLKEIVEAQEDLCRTLLNQPYDLADSRVEKVILQGLERWAEFLTTASNSSVIGFLNVLALFPAIKSLNDFWQTVSRLGDLKERFAKAITSDVNKVSTNTLIRCLQSNLVDKQEELLMTIQQRLLSRPIDFLVFRELVFFLDVLTSYDDNRQVFLKHLQVHSQTLLQAVSDFDFKKYVMSIQKTDMKAFRLLIMLPVGLHDHRLPKPNTPIRPYRINLLSALGSFFRDINDLLRLKMKADSRIQDYPVLKTFSFRFWHLVAPTYAFFGQYKDQVPGFGPDFAFSCETVEYFMNHYADSLNLDGFTKLLKTVLLAPHFNRSLTGKIALKINQIAHHAANSFSSVYEKMDTERVKAFTDFFAQLHLCCPNQENLGLVIQRGARGYATNYTEQLTQDAIINWLTALNEANALDCRSAFDLALHAVSLHNKEVLKMTTFYEFCVDYRSQMDRLLRALLVLPTLPTFGERHASEQEKLLKFRNSLLAEREEFRDLIGVDSASRRDEVNHPVRFRFLHFLRQKNLKFKKQVNFLSEIFDFYLPDKKVFVHFEHNNRTVSATRYEGTRRVMAVTGQHLIVHQLWQIDIGKETEEQNFKRLCEAILKATQAVEAP